jgi:hypothetical protein
MEEYKEEFSNVNEGLRTGRNREGEGMKGGW